MTESYCNITSCEMNLRVRYYEVDRQNAVHHSVYPVYFEMGRTELLRVNGYDYKVLEDKGIVLVVAKLECRYRSPARYDDELVLKTSLEKVDRVRLDHQYELRRINDKSLLVQGKTTLVHIDRSGKLQGLPGFLRPENYSKT